MAIDLSIPNVTNTYVISPGDVGPVNGWKQITTTACSVVTVELVLPAGVYQYSGSVGWLCMGWYGGVGQSAAWSLESGQPIVPGQVYVFEALAGAMMQDNRPWGPLWNRIRLAVGFWPKQRAMACSLVIREYW